MKLPTYEELKAEFEFISQSTDRGVSGIYRLDSGKPGPTVIISMLTHGNEPSGIAPLWHIRRSPHFVEQMLGGSLLFIANDLRAAEKSFACQTFEERMDCRCIDLNMNRLPEDSLDQMSPEHYEVQRLQELYSHLQEADAAIDIHSTSQDADPMIVEVSSRGRALLPGVPIKTVLTNAVEAQKGIPLCAFHGGLNRDIPIVEIEAGGHENPNSYKRAIETALQVLRNSCVLPAHQPLQDFEYEIYKMICGVWFPSLEYKFVKQFENFEPVKKGQILAEGPGEPITSPINGCALFAPAGGRIHSLEEEAMFLSESPFQQIL